MFSEQKIKKFFQKKSGGKRFTKIKNGKELQAVSGMSCFLNLVVSCFLFCLFHSMLQFLVNPGILLLLTDLKNKLSIKTLEWTFEEKRLRKFEDKKKLKVLTLENFVDKGATASLPFLHVYFFFQSLTQNKTRRKNFQHFWSYG